MQPPRKSSKFLNSIASSANGFFEEIRTVLPIRGTDK
jgi:hypothetical protein